MAQRGSVCIKYLLFACNLLFALTGLLIFFIAIVVQLKYQHFSNFMGENTWTAPVILMIVGGTVFVIGLVGCCGAIIENSCMIITFSILISLLLLLEIGVGVAVYIKHGELPQILEKEFYITMGKYNNRTEYKDAWNLIQSELDCCGIRDLNDWKIVFPNDTFPDSCCREVTLTSEIESECTSTDAHKNAGCLPKLLSIVDSNTLILGGIVLAVVSIQLLTILFACCLCNSFHRNYEIV